jgi:hypothetical protein
LAPAPGQELRIVFSKVKEKTETYYNVQHPAGTLMTVPVLKWMEALELKGCFVTVDFP